MDQRRSKAQRPGTRTWASRRVHKRRVLTPLILALLCLAAYARSLSIPLIEDDYPLLTQSQTYGTLSGVPALLRDRWPVPRTTLYWMMHPLGKWFGVRATGFHTASLFLHVLNTILLYGICLAWAPLRPAAFWAAAFFAIHEGHQEAVMWFSAANELLLFLFGAASLLCWQKSVNNARRGLWIAASVAAFSLALLSKESAVIFLPLLLTVTPLTEWRSRLPLLIPHCIVALVSLLWLASTRNSSFRFGDGSFSLSAPFWITWPNTYARLLWIWGIAALLWILAVRSKDLWRRVFPALIWLGIGLVPYSFLTYMTRLPSRHVYLASAGLAMLVGLAMADLATKWRAAATVVAVLMLLHNIGYIATRKQRQFLERAEPTEQLIALAKKTKDPIFVQCFPRPRIIAEEAVRLAAGRSPDTLLWSAPDASGERVAVFCYR